MQNVQCLNELVTNFVSDKNGNECKNSKLLHHSDAEKQTKTRKKECVKWILLLLFQQARAHLKNLYVSLNI